MMQQQPDDARIVEDFLANLDRLDAANDLPLEWSAAALFCAAHGSVRGLEKWVDLRRRIYRLERGRAASSEHRTAGPTVNHVQQFLAGAARDAEQLRALLELKFGCYLEPTGDFIEFEGVLLTVGYEPHGGRTLRAEETCATCGDPVRSLPIESRADLALFACGEYRAPHQHGWLTGGM